MAPDRHLLVDAYNVIHAWPELRALLVQHGPDAAQAKLIDALRPIHDTEGWRVSIVFDGKGDEILIERPGTELTFSLVYGPKGLSADGVIEQIVANTALPAEQDRRPSKRQRHADAPEIVVATRDNLLGESAAANGARLLSPTGLREWAGEAAARQTREVLARQRLSGGDWKKAVSPWSKLQKVHREDAKKVQ